MAKHRSHSDNRSEGGAQARRRAERSLAETKRQWPPILKLSKELRELRAEDDHFAELIRYRLMERRGTNHA